MWEGSDLQAMVTQEKSLNGVYSKPPPVYSLFLLIICINIPKGYTNSPVGVCREVGGQEWGE